MPALSRTEQLRNLPAGHFMLFLSMYFVFSFHSGLLFTGPFFFAKFLFVLQCCRRISGGAAVTLEVLPPEPKGFLERNRKGITMMFGVIIASSVVKFMRCVFKANQSNIFALEIRQHRRSAMYRPRYTLLPCCLIRRI